MKKTMKYSFGRRVQITRYALILVLLAPLFSFTACTQGEASSGSDLMEKIDAVHKQMMVQGNISEEERKAILALASLVGGEGTRTKSEDVAGVLEFDDADMTPVYPGCEARSPEETRSCFMEHINGFFEEQFDKEIAQELGIKEAQTVEVIFKITESGEVTKLKVRDANVRIQAEAARVFRLLPKFKAAVHNGESVAVMCTVVVPYGG